MLKVLFVCFFRLLTMQDAYFEVENQGLISDLLQQTPMLGGGYAHFLDLYMNR